MLVLFAVSAQNSSNEFVNSTNLFISTAEYVQDVKVLLYFSLKSSIIFEAHFSVVKFDVKVS